MKAFLVLCASVLIAVGVGVAVESGQSSAPPPRVPPTVVHVATVRIRPEGPCPSSITEDQDVTNPSSANLHRELLPPGALSGLICRYQQADAMGITLRSHALVNGRTAALFESEIARMSTTTPTGRYACPAAFPGATVLAFGYANGSYVDLWYSDSGCQTLDNGVLRAYDVSGAAAFAVFSSLVNQLAPEPSIG